MLFTTLFLGALAISASAADSDLKVHRRSNSKRSPLKHNAEQARALSTRATASSSTWLNLGCRQDGPSRVLSSNIAISGSMTVDSCIASCAAAGYIFAGVEYSTQCWCGNSLLNGLGASIGSGNCNMACGGNSGQSCGGSYTMNLWSTPVTHVGCYADSSSRLLSGPSEIVGTMSPQLCVTWCNNQGYPYAGVEYGSQCYCGSSLSASQISSSYCNSACGGESDTTCGGTWVLDVYTGPTTTPTATTGANAGLTSLGCYADSDTRVLVASTEWITGSLTPALCASHCYASGYVYSGVEYATQCYCGSSLSSTQTSTNCNMACSGDSSQICGGSYAINIYKYSGSGTTTSSTTTTTTTTAAASPTATGLNSLGCYYDSGSPRLLGSTQWYTSTNSPANCAAYCYNLGYVYSGVEYSSQCYCGTSLPSSASSSTSCNMACTGDSSQTCGGSYAINVYKYVAGTTTTTSTAIPTSVAAGSALTSIGCFADSDTRVLLASTQWITGSLTPALCASHCYASGYTFSGVEYSTQCYCGNGLSSTQTSTNCNMACGGDSSKTCGGSYAINVYTYGGGSGGVTITSSTTTTATPTTAYTASATSNAAATLVTTTVAAAAASNTKALWAHHIIGNTYTYGVSDWASDISLAQSSGIDGFALNFGAAQWEYNSIGYAYQAAQGTGFKLFLSFDFTAFGCSGTGDASNVVNLINTYKGNSAQAMYNGNPIVSTFSGDGCTFGQTSVTAGWNSVRSSVGSMYLVPAIFPTNGAADFSSMPWFDAELNWNSGWPMGGSDLTTASDQQYIGDLSGRGYMAAISPCFFTYYSPSSYNKNWIYRSDDWLLAQRFEMLIGMRNQFDMAEIISWNDFGESHYIGPIAPNSDQPNSEGWVNGFPHTAWLSLIAYYAPAFKTGVYPTPSDGLWIWSRPSPKNAQPSSPSMSQPANAQYTDDKVYAMAILASPATVTVTSGSNSVTYNLNTGVNKISLASAAGVITAKMIRNGATVKSIDSTGSFSYTNTPTDWNFNYWVGSA